MKQIMFDLVKKQNSDVAKMIVDRVKLVESDCERLHALPAQRQQMEKDVLSELEAKINLHYKNKADQARLAGNIDEVKKYDSIKYGYYLYTGKNQKGEEGEVSFKISEVF